MVNKATYEIRTPIVDKIVREIFDKLLKEEIFTVVEIDSDKEKPSDNENEEYKEYEILLKKDLQKEKRPFVEDNPDTLPEIKNSLELGFYEKMRSPGKIGFCIDHLYKFSLNILIDCMHRKNIDFRPFDLVKLIEMVVMKTFYHEHFHFYSDLFSYLSSSFNFDHEIEEALSVSFSYHVLNGNIKIRRWPFMRNSFVDIVENTFKITYPFRSGLSWGAQVVVLKVMFSYYKSLYPYNQWINYRNQVAFRAKLEDYFKFSNYTFLKKSISHIDKYLISNILNTINYEIDYKIY